MARRLAAQLRFPFKLGVAINLPSSNKLQKSVVELIQGYDDERVTYESVIPGKRRSGRTTAALLAILAIIDTGKVSKVRYMASNTMEVDSAMKMFNDLLIVDNKKVIKESRDGVWRISNVQVIFSTINDLTGEYSSKMGLVVDNWTYISDYNQRRMQMMEPKFLVRVQDIIDIGL